MPIVVQVTLKYLKFILHTTTAPTTLLLIYGIYFIVLVANGKGIKPSRITFSLLRSSSEVLISCEVEVYEI